MCDSRRLVFATARLYLDLKRKEWVGSTANAARCIGAGRGVAETNERQPPLRLGRRISAHLRRWKMLVSIYLNVVSYMGRGAAIRSMATTTLIFGRTRPRFRPFFCAKRHEALARYLKGWWA